MSSVSGSKGVIDETSPDLLKNTSSNIRRLADEIEHLEEPAAAVPKTEIVGKGDYFRFGMIDSLAIEASFLQREDDLLSCWWKEYAACSEGPKREPHRFNRASEISSPESSQADEDLVEEERVGVPVKGGLYEELLER